MSIEALYRILKIKF